jgi:DNA-binding CsgD family transcriptional regulator
MLTVRQLEHVCLLANGYTIDEIAKKLFVSRGTSEKTLMAARRRVGAITNAHLVSIVIAAGDLEWNTDTEMRSLNGNGNSK